ncbi:MAG: hypothetical protein ACRD1K_20630 [Acidimicrobiales bacterium]
MTEPSDPPVGPDGAAPAEPVSSQFTEEHWQALTEQLRTLGLPMIVYIFAGENSVAAHRLILETTARQMAAVSQELDEWSRLMVRSQLQAQMGQPPPIARPTIAVPGKFDPRTLGRRSRRH